MTARPALLTVGRTPTLVTAGRAPSGRTTRVAYTPKPGAMTPWGTGRLAVGEPRVRPISLPCTTVPDSMWGWPRNRAACSSSPASTRVRMWVEEMVTPSSSTLGITSQPMPSRAHLSASRWGSPSPR